MRCRTVPPSLPTAAPARSPSRSSKPCPSPRPSVRGIGRSATPCSCRRSAPSRTVGVGVARGVRNRPSGSLLFGGLDFRCVSTQIGFASASALRRPIPRAQGVDGARGRVRQPLPGRLSSRPSQPPRALPSTGGPSRVRPLREQETTKLGGHIGDCADACDDRVRRAVDDPGGGVFRARLPPSSNHTTRPGRRTARLRPADPWACTTPTPAPSRCCATRAWSASSDLAACSAWPRGSRMTPRTPAEGVHSVNTVFAAGADGEAAPQGCPMTTHEPSTTRRWTASRSGDPRLARKPAPAQTRPPSRSAASIREQGGMERSSSSRRRRTRGSEYEVMAGRDATTPPRWRS